MNEVSSSQVNGVPVVDAQQLAIIPDKTELLAADSLLPVLATLEAMSKEAKDEGSIRQLLEGSVMVDAVARERKLDEQANRAKALVTKLRARLGSIAPDGRKGRSGGDQKSGSKVSKNEPLISPSEKLERHENKKLAELGEEKVSAITETLIEEGIRPSARKVLETAKKEARGQSSGVIKPVIEQIRGRMDAIFKMMEEANKSKQYSKSMVFVMEARDALPTADQLAQTPEKPPVEQGEAAPVEQKRKPQRISR